MDFSYSAEDEAFRREFRAWLEQNAPRNRTPPLDGMTEEDKDEWHRKVGWWRKLASAGWTCVDWPKQYRGRGLSLLQTIIYHQELQRVNAPLPFIGSGPSLVGPTLMHWGTEEQKSRFIPEIVSGEEIWCQGYSEPNAGSDLASLQTRAVKDGDHWVLNGQKVWTSFAQVAHWMMLLARTDPQAPRHKGITYFLLDMKLPGVVVKPLRQITGEAEFNEVFLDNVRVHESEVLGGVNNGWQVGITTLMYERLTLGFGLQMRLRIAFDSLIELARRMEKHGRVITKDPLWRQKLAH